MRKEDALKKDESLRRSNLHISLVGMGRRTSLRDFEMTEMFVIVIASDATLMITYY